MKKETQKVKPYYCAVCQKRFKTWWNRNQHHQICGKPTQKQTQNDYIKSAKEKQKQNSANISALKSEILEKIDEIEDYLRANLNMKITMEKIKDGSIAKERKGIIGEL